MPGHRERVTRLVTTIALTSLALLNAACPGPKDSANNTPNAESARSGQRQSVENNKPAELKGKAEAMTEQEFRYEIDAVTFAEPNDTDASHHAPRRRCKVGGPPSPNCSLRIVPARGAYLVSLDSLGANGRILAKIQNEGDSDEVVLNIPGKLSGGGNTIRYLVARKKANGHEAVLINPRDPRDVHYQKDFKRCPAVGPPHTYNHSKARLLPCDSVHATGRRDSLAAMALLVHLSGPWITCAEGCCYGEGGSGG